MYTDLQEIFVKIINNSIRNLQKFCFGFKKTKGEIAIVGDYYIDLLKIEHKPIIRDYLDSIVPQGFFPKITLPTR